MLTHKFALLEDEKIKNTYRQSTVFVLKPALISLLIICLPTYFLWKYELITTYKTLVYLLIVACLLWFAREALIWYRNNYVLTNQRLLLFEHNGLFKHTVIETPLERILNVSYKTTGIMSAIWGYGNVEVQVVGLVEPVMLKYIPDPEFIKDYLWQMHKRVTPKPISFQAQEINKYQEQVGYTKKNQRLM